MMAYLSPYTAYKNSGVPWLGRIPAHWTQAPGRACYREKKLPNTGMRETTVLSLSYGQIVVKPPEKLHGLVPASFETYQIIDPGDIVVRPTDLQNDWNSLRFGLSRQRGIITSAYICLHTEDLITREYGHVLLHAYDLKKVFYGLGSGLRQNLDWRDFKYLPCLVPPPDEQHAITRYLDHIDRRIRRYIRAKRKLIALLEEQKQAVIHRAVTGQIDVRTGRPYPAYKPSGVEWLGDVPEHWEMCRLKNVAQVQTGLTLGKNYGSSGLTEYPYLRVANVQSGFLDLKHVATVRIPHTEAAGCQLQYGDVLMTEGGDRDKLGRGCVWYGEIEGCLHQNHVFAVRADPARLLPEFLVLLMTSGHGRSYFEQTAKQTTNLASTNSTTLRAFPLFLPDISEQRLLLDQVVNQTESFIQASAATQREIALLREYRTRLIADVVTGQVDVRAAAAQLPAEVEEFDALDEAEAELVEDVEGESQVMAG